MCARIVVLIGVVITFSGRSSAQVSDQSSTRQLAVHVTTAAIPNVKSTDELTAILRSVTDKPSAEAALPKLKQLEHQRLEQDRESNSVSQEDYASAIDQLAEELLPEFQRIDKMPELKALLAKKSIWFRESFEREGAEKSTAWFAAAEAQSRLDPAQIRELPAVVKSIIDENTLEAALSKLKTIDLLIEADENDWQALDAELARLEKIPDVLSTLCGASADLKEFFEFRAESRVAQNETSLLLITAALAVYQEREDKYPENLKVLTEGQDPLLAAEYLNDPWGQPYRYERTGPRNNGTQPDVWTVTPDNRLIGNWDTR